MPITSVHFKDHPCYKSDWAGFDQFRPINVIVGKNNTGKSKLLDLVRELFADTVGGSHWPMKMSGTLSEEQLKSVFHEHNGGGDLSGNHWRDNGRLFIECPISWQIRNRVISRVEAHLSDRDVEASGGRIQRIQTVLPNVSPPFHGKAFFHLQADRDIKQEIARKEECLGSDGTGATNLIRRFITNSKFPRDLIQKDMLNALNEIFVDNAIFSSIDVRQHDDALSGNEGLWEIYLGEEKKGLVPLSGSGSGLKTIILVLLVLLVVPRIPNSSPVDGHVFAFEELENNLHPALLRRLVEYIEKQALLAGNSVFITTHSPTIIDAFGASKHAQLIHVHHDGSSARTSHVAAHFEKVGILSALGARPSDLLQANGIIWVEGPSDRIYINKWIELASGGKFVEGRHYQCVFYGGALLARYEFNPSEENIKEFANLLRLNTNVVVVCDSDRRSTQDALKARTSRILDEVKKNPNAISWVTDCKEIENYIPGRILCAAFERDDISDPGQFEYFFPSTKSTSFLETQLGRKGVDKVELANLCTQFMTVEEMSVRFDWAERTRDLLRVLGTWNK